MTNTNTHHNNRPSIGYTLAISLTTTLFIISVQHLMLVTKQPTTYTQMYEMTNRAQGSFLRNHPSHHLDQQHLLHPGPPISNTINRDDNDDFLDLPSIWHDEFFSPLLESSLMNDFRRNTTILSFT